MLGSASKSKCSQSFEGYRRSTHEIAANRRFAPRGAGAWAVLARSELLPACKVTVTPGELLADADLIHFPLSSTAEERGMKLSSRLPRGALADSLIRHGAQQFELGRSSELVFGHKFARRGCRVCGGVSGRHSTSSQAGVRLPNPGSGPAIGLREVSSGALAGIWTRREECPGHREAASPQ